MPVYTDRENYITPDSDAHNVADGWKMFDRSGDRLGTFGWNLTRLKG
jgi:filamentous hemagglutinin